MGDRKCNEMTKIYYPQKLQLEEFLDEIESQIKSFKENMLLLEQGSKFAEEWMRVFAAWMEMI